jgi:predicted transcriptional regulator
MNTIALALKVKKTERFEVRAVCPLCGHTAIIVCMDGEQEVYCPDKYCPNCKDRHEE